MPRGWLLWLCLLMVLLAAPAQAAGDPLEEAKVLTWQVEEMDQAGRYQEALPLAQRALEIREKALGPEHPQTAISLRWMATLYMAMGAYDQALPLYQRALQISEKILGPEHPDIGGSLNNLAELYREIGAYDQALPLHQRSLKIYEKVLGPEHPHTVVSLNNLALLYQDMGNYDQALPLFQRALKINEKVLGPEHPDTALSLSNLAQLYQTMGTYDQALPLYQRSLKIREKVLGAEHPDIGGSLNNLAELYREIGAYDQALPLYQRSLKIAEKVLGPEHPHTAGSLNNLALLYQDMGNYDQALRLYQRSLKVYEKVLGPEHPTTAKILSNMATLYLEIGTYDQALPLYQRSLKIREKVLGAEHPKTATSLSALATLYQDMGNYDQALRLYQRSLKIYEKVLGPEHPETARCLRNLGALYLNRRDYEKAENLFRCGKSWPGLVEIDMIRGRYKEALKHLKGLEPAWRSTISYQIQYFTQFGLAQAGLGRRKEAAGALLQALQLVEELRHKVTIEHSGIFQGGIYGSYVRPYRGLVTVLAELALKSETLPPALKEYGPDAGAAAFYFAESTKGRVLLENLAAAARKESRVEIPDELSAREENLLNQLAALEANWEKALKGGEVAVKEMQEKKAHLTGELRMLIQELRQKFPLYAALHHPLPVPAADLPLMENEVLLEYALGEKASYVMVVRKGGVAKIVKISMGREELEGKVKAFMEPFINLQTEGFSLPQAEQLYDLLLSGVVPEAKETDRVIIVPDGILGLLPFEALVLKKGQNLQDSVFVGDKYNLTYYQSAAVLALKRRLKEEPASRPLFALGNPVFNTRDPRYVAAHGGKPAGPVLAKAQEGYAFRGLASREEWGQTTKNDKAGKVMSFPPLPQTEQEVRTIAGILGVKPEPPDVLLNLEANETRLLNSPLGEYRYLHFATHADLPGRVQGVNEPFILLGQVDNAEGDDGLLTMSKVLGLKLNAEMVVLSACLTGRGQVMEGEGVVNFARAFQQAGAKSVLVSLWEVASNETVEYMTLFYDHLKEGKSRSQALRLARQEIKAKHPQPFYWAAFILHGEG